MKGSFGQYSMDGISEEYIRCLIPARSEIAHITNRIQVLDRLLPCQFGLQVGEQGNWQTE